MVYVPAPLTFAKMAPSVPVPEKAAPLLRSLCSPTYSEDSVNARPTCWPLPLAPANESVTRPPTSLPKSSTTYEFAPEIRVDCPDRALLGALTEPDVLWIATGARVRVVGE